MAEEKSAYELQRDQNIANNNAMLRSLGLEQPIVTKATKAAAPRKRKQDVGLLPVRTRKSARLSNDLVVHQELLESSSDDEGDDSRKQKKTKGKAKDRAPKKDSIPLRQSLRRSHKILPQVVEVYDEESDDDSDDDNVVFTITDDQASDSVFPLASGQSSSMTFSILDGIDNLPIPDDIAPLYNHTDGSVFVQTMFFMDSETTLRPLENLRS
jgi:hypothetical protein